MFQSNKFCHIASNNRNQVKVGVFVYRTTDDLATVLTSGYFNPRITDINLHDLIIHEKVDDTDKTKVERNVLCVIERTLENVGTIAIKSKWEGDIEQEIEDLRTYVDNTFVKKDGSSVMTGPLKFRAGSFVGAIAGGLGDGISIYKLKSDDTIDSEVASLTKENGFTPGTTNTQDIGSTSLKWKDAYIARVITAVLNNGANINVPTTSGTLALTTDIKNGTLTIQKNGTDIATFSANQDTNATANISVPTQLNDLTDVSISSATNGQWLQYDGSAWKNISLTPANIDLSNLSSTGANIANWSSNTTNCIVEVPKDIKLEKTGTGGLTIKTGSKLYQPNGSGTFTPVVLDTDKTRSDFSAWGTGTYTIFRSAGQYSANDGIIAVTPANAVSGSTDTSTAGTHIWYDTTNNKVKLYSGGSYIADDLSFPVAIVSIVNGTGITMINRTFNGFGYIGHHIYALPGVKGLIPNGRNAGGTLSNTVFTLSTVQIQGYATSYTDYIVSLSSGLIGIWVAGRLVWDESSNYNFNTQSGSVEYSVICGKVSCDGTHITSFEPLWHPFQAVDYNDIGNAITKSKSFGDNGYCKLANGMIIQWGNFDANTAPQTITFPTPFSSSTSYSLAFSYVNLGSVTANVEDFSVASRTATGFTTFANITRNATKLYIAIGY